jgi:hypothetical protein
MSKEKPGVRNFRIRVMLLGSGFSAVMLADYEDMDWNTDIVQTGIGRYKTREMAEIEAKDWARSEQIPYEGEKN